MAERKIKHEVTGKLLTTIDILNERLKAENVAGSYALVEGIEDITTLLERLWVGDK